MPLVLTGDQQLLATTAASFLAERSPVSRVRELRDTADADGFSRELWKQMAALGWTGIPFAETYGGAGMGITELAVILEPLGRHLAPEPFLSTVMLGGQALQRGGTDAQQATWLAGVVQGDRFLALAQQERGSRFDLHRVTTRAEVSDGGFRISGEKVAVLDGSVADAFVVVVRTAGNHDDLDGLTLLLVPATTPGLRVERQWRIDSRNAATVRFDGCEIGADAAIGPVGQGLRLLEDTTDRATAALCAEMLGSMSEAFERTIEYLKTRRQFGAPIGSFQALKHRAAGLFIEIELCRSAVMAATRAIDEENPEASRLVSLAKARCSETSVQVTNEAVQMHGGIGMTDELEIGFFVKRARVAELTLGDAAWHRDRWARLGGY